MFIFRRRVIEHKKIVFKCSDPRYLEDFDAFIRQDLGLIHPGFSEVTVTGSAIALAFPDATSEEIKSRYDFAVNEVRYLLTAFPSFDTLILTVHEDCARLRDVDCFGKGMEEQILHLAGRNASLLFPQLKIELYYGRKKQLRKRRLAFERILQQSHELAR